MKRPSLQFYVGDWQSNTNLRRCTFAEKGIWLEAMCLMHDAEQYGVLRWPLKEIAQAIGCKVSELLALKTKGVLKGADAGEKTAAHVYTPRHAGKDGEPVILLPEQDGPIWFSSRMVNDEYVRNTRGKGTRFGEQKLPPKVDDDPPPTQRVGERQGEEPSQGEGDGPSTSSSLSESKEEVVVVSASVIDPRYLKIRSKVLEHFPKLIVKDAGVIHAWIAEADTELDILPAIDLAKAQNSKPSGFGYFTPMISTAKENRLTPLPKGSQNGSHSRNGAYGTAPRKTKSEIADDAMHDALVDLGIAH
jgi:hypothetical protein